MKVPHLRCDSHTSSNVKRSKVRVTSGRGHTVSAEPGGHTECFAKLGKIPTLEMCEFNPSRVSEWINYTIAPLPRLLPFVARSVSVPHAIAGLI